MKMETGQVTIMEMKKENARELAQLLKTVVFKEDGHLHYYDRGLRFTLDDGLYQQANAFISTSFFSDFKIKEANLAMKLPLKSLFEFLSMAEGNSSSVKFTYSGMFEPLKVIMEDADGCIIRARLKTSVPDEELEFEFDNKKNKIPVTYMLKTQVLKEIFKDLDETSRTVKIQFTRSEIAFSTFGEVGEITVAIPSKSLQMETVECLEEIDFSYRSALIQRMNCALGLGSKVVFRVDERGVLCCQFTVDHGDNRQSYIEYLTVPCEDEEEEEEEEAAE